MSLRFGSGPGEDAKRLHSTVRVDLEARFMLPSKEEHNCRVLEMSTGGMSISSAASPRPGDQIIIYIAELGRFEARVEAPADSGFSVSMSLTPHKHKKLAEQLVWYANRDALDLPENRRHKRFVPLNHLTTVRFMNGRECMARINDISASGVNVEINLSVNSKVTILVGGSVVVGSKKTTVIRVFEGGFVAKFDEIFEEGEIDETITL